MRWYELTHNPRAITHLYDEVPPLEQMELIEFILKRDGPKLICKMNFPRFADHPPERWHKDYNTVHIELEFWTLSDFSIEGFPTTPMLTFSLEQVGKKIQVCAEAPGCGVRFHCETIFIQKVSGYIKET